MIVENGFIRKTEDKFDSFELTTSKNKKLFQLNVKQNELLKHGQTIACLKEDIYKTETGGIIYYSTNYPLPGNQRKRSTKKIFTGFLYWVPEETHQLGSLDAEQINFKDGHFVTKGTSLLPNVFSKIDGFVQISDQNSELIVKPGELYQITKNQKASIDTCNRFLQPGEVLFSNIFVQKLSYLEFVKFQGLEYVLLRPVITYKVPQEKGFFLKYRFFPNINNRSVAFRTVKRVFYKDGERVKSSDGVDLLQTFLVLDIRNKYAGLNSKIEYLPLKADSAAEPHYKLKLTLYEKIKVNDLKITLMPAVHWSKRSLWDTNKSLWGSFLIEYQNKKIFFASDTGYGNIYKELGNKYGPIDLTLINIGAYNFYPMASIKDKSIYHTNPEEALNIGKDLKSKKVLGMHWGTVVLSLEPIFEPPKRFKNSSNKYGYHPDDAIIFKIGQVEKLENILK